MEDHEFARRMDALESKLDAVYQSSEKLRTLLTWIVIISVALFVLPLVGLVFAIPSFLSTYGSLVGV